MLKIKAAVGAAFCLAVLLSTASFRALGQNPSAPAPQTKSSETEELRRQIQELKQGQDAIQKELLEIKRLLLARDGGRPSRPDKITVNARPFKGNDNARIVVVEYSDYQCPFCARFYRETLPLIDKEYIQAGKIKYVFNNLPLDDLHPVAFKAAEAVECAGEQGKFWDLHGRFFSDQNLLVKGDVSAPAKSLGLNMTQFEQCLSSKKTEPVVRAGVAQAESLGIQSTPSFVIGAVEGNKPGEMNVKIVGIINGAYPYPVFKAALDKALATP